MTDFWWGIILIVVALCVVVGIAIPCAVFATEHHPVLIDTEISDEMAIKLWEGDPENRVWFVDAGGVIIGENSFFEMTFATRGHEKDRLYEFLDSLGLQYHVRSPSIKRAEWADD